VIRIGTSGWHYPHWRGPFYPHELPSEAFLRRYAETFDTVEANATFYRLPSEATVAAWRAAVPDRFVFAVKASRFITHMKKLRGVDDALATFLSRVRVFGDTLGPVLFQLPPRWRLDAERLATFVAALPPGLRSAFEFRDETWFDERAYQVLRGHGTAFCVYDLAGRESPLVVTADFVYLRLHGPGAAYGGDYTVPMLTRWARVIGGWAAQGKDVYCYLDNDAGGYAPKNAVTLRRMLGAS
jgi:uncharacterized protein YecE (DUF72 family)